MQRPLARVPSACGSWQVTSFSDCFLKVALSGLRNELFKNYGWSLDTEFNIFFTFRMWNTIVRDNTPKCTVGSEGRTLRKTAAGLNGDANSLRGRTGKQPR